MGADQTCELSVELAETSYFLSTIELGVGDSPDMPRWRKRLFVATSGITADAAEYFGLPRDRVVIMGSHISVWSSPQSRPAASRLVSWGRLWRLRSASCSPSAAPSSRSRGSAISRAAR
ncbi:hypothetical protein ACIBL3_27825 [Kribbella sp. NPDC050124]|uniref:KUP/HAK/KT family potassium transporter n=1 Tax=Kribbella sp. NPDC050124 TaxID=3364114 RepID=UPI0037ADA5DE